jgi:hypothetical protein
MNQKILLGMILSLIGAMFIAPFLLLRHFDRASQPPDEVRDAVTSTARHTSSSLLQTK